MKFYMAPMEGITGYVYRRAYNRYFHDVDKYFMPFIDARLSGKFGSKEKKDIAPENNEEMCAVPQILANNAESFINTAGAICDRGYTEINLNLGCPSATVFTKGKGAGALSSPEKLEEFLYGIFEKADMNISIKTRLGIDNTDEFYRIIEVYNKYPVSELIIHPRVRDEFYNGTPHVEIYKNAMSLCKMPLCYNGNIFTANDYENICSKLAGNDKVMLGRGLLSNPGLIGNISGRCLDKDTLKGFCDMIYTGYREDIPGPKNFLFKVKELWFYMSRIFTNYEPYYKKIMKADDAISYEIAVNNLFREQDIDNGKGFSV